MLHINKIAKSLDARRQALVNFRRQLQALVKRSQTDATLAIEVVFSAAALDERCSASIRQSVELYHMLSVDFYWATQGRAAANLIKAQTRLAAEHQVIAAMVAGILKPPDRTQLN